uniref:Calmodulin n=1 Tax=Macrostomum lignano TaxID=282301 RepID=A0A1I8GTJ7_9PLAT
MSDDKYIEVFQKLDEDRDGSISPDEMASALRTSFPDMGDSEFENMHKLATMGGSRSLGQNDFVSFMKIMEINATTDKDLLPTRAVQLFYLVHDESEAVGCEELAKLNPAEHNLTPEEVNILAVISKRLQDRGLEMIGFAKLWRDVQAELQKKDLARPIDMDDNRKYRDVFKQFDLNGDGHITINELTVAVQAAGVNISKESLQDSAETSPRLQQLFDVASDGFDLVGPDELKALSPDDHGLTSQESKVLTAVIELLQGRSVDLAEFADLWRKAEAAS